MMQLWEQGLVELDALVEDVSGEPLDRYLKAHIFEPLGMADTNLLQSERIQTCLATGYRLGSGGAKTVTDRQQVTAAASSIYSTPRDVARYVAALMAEGANAPGAILGPSRLATMFEPHYQPDLRLLRELICVPEEDTRTDIPQHPEIWADICGWYQARGQRSDMQARSMAGAGVHVVVSQRREHGS